jgi:hypothetical protein
MFFSGMLIFVGTLVAVYAALEFVRPLRHTNPFAG